MDNIDKEYDQLVEHLHDYTKKAEGFKTIKRYLSFKTFEVIRQREAARAASNQIPTFKLARLCRQAIKEDLREKSNSAGWSCRDMKKYPLSPSFGTQREQCPLASSPSEGKQTCHSRGSPVRNTTCYHVGKKSYGIRPRENKNKAPEEHSVSTHQHSGEAPYTLPVRTQGS